MSKKRIVRLGVVIGFLFLLATQVFAAEECFGFDDGRVFVDEDVSLEPGERFSGDLAVFGGDLTIPQGSTVNGDVFVSGGTVLVAGRVNGDLAVTSGDLLLDESGYVLSRVASSASQGPPYWGMRWQGLPCQGCPASRRSQRCRRFGT